MDTVSINITEVVEQVSITVTESAPQVVSITVAENINGKDGKDGISVISSIEPGSPIEGQLWIDTNTL